MAYLLTFEGVVMLRLFGVFFLFISLSFFGFNGFGKRMSSYPAMDVAWTALESDTSITVTKVDVSSWVGNASYYEFFPTQKNPTIGFIFYPGGRVEAESYASMLRKIAHQGFAVYLIKMPFDMAVLGKTRANTIIEKYSHKIQHWFIGGHSLGGVGASFFTKNFKEKIDSLILWASYPSKTYDLSNISASILSIYATLDGKTKLKDIKENQDYLPAETEYFEILGGNHTQFGDYGDGSPQYGDNEPDISRKRQQHLILNATMRFLKKME